MNPIRKALAELHQIGKQYQREHNDATHFVVEVRSTHAISEAMYRVLIDALNKDQQEQYRADERLKRWLETAATELEAQPAPEVTTE